MKAAYKETTDSTNYPRLERSVHSGNIMIATADDAGVYVLVVIGSTAYGTGVKVGDPVKSGFGSFEPLPVGASVTLTN